MPCGRRDDLTAPEGLGWESPQPVACAGGPSRKERLDLTEENSMGSPSNVDRRPLSFVSLVALDGGDRCEQLASTVPCTKNLVETAFGNREARA